MAIGRQLDAAFAAIHQIAQGPNNHNQTSAYQDPDKEYQYMCQTSSCDITCTFRENDLW